MQEKREDQGRWREAADLEYPTPRSQQKQPEAKTGEQKETPAKKKRVEKRFPDSALFRQWGEGLSEEDQAEAERLFQNYGYNVFLSDRLPLSRDLPETRDPRYRCLGHFCFLQRGPAEPLNVL